MFETAGRVTALLFNLRSEFCVGAVFDRNGTLFSVAIDDVARLKAMASWEDPAADLLLPFLLA
jgi:hypothetical protein